MRILLLYINSSVLEIHFVQVFHIPYTIWDTGSTHLLCKLIEMVRTCFPILPERKESLRQLIQTPSIDIDMGTCESSPWKLAANSIGPGTSTRSTEPEATANRTLLSVYRDSSPTSLSLFSLTSIVVQSSQVTNSCVICPRMSPLEVASAAATKSAQLAVGGTKTSR